MPIRLEFDTVGSGPPVVMLHGLFGCGRNWARIAHALGDSYRVYLPDARNHGASSRSPTMSYANMAHDVLNLIEREQLRQPVLIGHSIGGKTAMTVALENPGAISGVAVVDTAPEFHADRFSPYMVAMRSLDMAAATNRDEIRQAFTQYMADEAPVDLVAQNLQRHREHCDWRLNLLSVAGCMQELCGFPLHLRHELYDGPALFLAGAESDYIRPEKHAGIRRSFPRARMECIAGAGHWVHADQPDALLHALRGWLPQAAARSGASAVGAARPLN